MKAIGAVFVVVALTIGITLFVGPALSQNTAPSGSGSTPANNMDIMRQKIQADKKAFIAQNMQLTQAEANAFWPVYDQLQKGLVGLGDRLAADVQEYAANYQSLSDATAKKLTEDYLAIQGDRVKLLQSYLPKFRAVLPEKKVARYYQLENKAYAIVLYDLMRQIPLVK